MKSPVAALCLVLLALPVFGAPPDADPETLIRGMTQGVLAAARADPDIASGGPKALKLAEERIFPLVDFEEATRLALGRFWPQASKAQQARLVAEFRALLVRTAGAGQRYEGQTVTVLPARMQQGGTEATVRNRYLRPGAAPLRIDFQMHRTAAGWKIYDIVVEGVSLVFTYRSEFDAVLKQQGIDGLIRRLAEKNAPAKIS